MAIGEARDVAKAKQGVRAKEAAVWNDREQAGQRAIQAEAKERQGAGESAPKAKEHRGQTMEG